MDAGALVRRAARAQVLVDAGALGDDPVVPAPADVHHLARVLRLREGEVVIATDGAGRWVPTAVRGAAGSLVLVPSAPPASEPEPAPGVVVGFGLTKGDKPELVVQKLTELGVDRIVPVLAARSVVRWDAERAARNLERLRTVAREASMQCRRVRLPVVEAPRPVLEALRSLDEAGVPVGLAEPDGAERPSLERPAVFVGPEGGWAAEELAHRVTVRLGETTLRAETAALVAGSLLCALRSGTVGRTP